ncbi:hypothetical protein A2715_05350 [Candidatus Woesebacteria bacterium RIFCSPHIGHO2_01_FULL_39_32]|uniref:DUF4352 domain-containing protein n=1 Tax=Candidatus Woesebacteria bacterium RIFCSPLOWO2_01_FULL_39_25 TaxID=1802521 RepID=A0A1F8BLN6_9BACT|nr:MAG: hypothetical protein A2715_05350 [Candidatus Woesebacteria bacterium RIFCSPHIGHO2_01_FULL_39_32]OGM38549.1 MAG: hypothetical protein A3F01_04310 [Candidatus Woesebacteria bacterium RIFCSPHIGHO2_12_FULL_38_11]OGM64976.1 MAG: hypothetical protein A2893_04960 [Candidatus Woesebacteria bacterium RIFCSPLOWO2_01_FULL_39_25]
MRLRLLVIVLFILLLIAVGIIILLIKQQNFYFSFEKAISPTPTLTIAPTQTPTPSQNPTKKGELNKNFSIPLTDSSGNLVSGIEYTLTEYEITDEIRVKGQTAKAISGRKFLVINIKVDNQLDRVIEINTKDYIRLSVNNSDNWLAPDIHNDPVEVQALSTKFTRLGFAINEKDMGFELQLGKLNGQKENLLLF